MSVKTNRKKHHGWSGTPEHKAWLNMRNRCRNQKNKMYARYGGRGIQVCSRWNSFECFIEDMGARPSPGHTVERINNDGNYEPSNVKWATRFEQNNNTSRNKFIEFDGIKRTISQWARACGINKHTLEQRLERGWSIKEALENLSGTRLAKNINHGLG